MDYPDYRPRPDRCIHVIGEISLSTVEKLIPRITELTGYSCSDPITVYIDSNGGAVVYADLLFELLTQPDVDGRRCKVITVATHRAQSAAAIFLARGDYAIAQRTAWIHFHGLRQQALVTTESAAMLSSELQTHNDRYALNLASSSMTRFLWIINSFQTELPPFESSDFVGALGDWLSQKISKNNAELVQRALSKYEDAKKLSRHIFSKLRLKKNSTPGMIDIAVLKAILDYEIKAQPKTWRLRGEGFNQLRNDFLQFHDYHWGEHRATFSGMVGPLLIHLLPTSERSEYFSLEKEEDQKEWIEKHVKPRAEPLWYFVLSLCRLLYEGENSIEVEEAYWLGLIDEVAGSELPCIRSLYEEASEQEAAENSAAQSNENGASE